MAAKQHCNSLPDAREVISNAESLQVAHNALDALKKAIGRATKSGQPGPLQQALNLANSACANLPDARQVISKAQSLLDKLQVAHSALDALEDADQDSDIDNGADDGDRGSEIDGGVRPGSGADDSDGWSNNDGHSGDYTDDDEASFKDELAAELETITTSGIFRNETQKKFTCWDQKNCLLVQLKSSKTNPRPSHPRGNNQPWWNIILLSLDRIVAKFSGHEHPAVLQKKKKMDALSNQIFEWNGPNTRIVCSTADGVNHHEP